MKIELCPICSSESLFEIDMLSCLCIDCEHIHSVESRKCDKLSVWIWKRQYFKNKEGEQ